LIREQIKNYQMEYDRIRNAIEKSVAPGITKRMLEDRLEHLKKLGAKAVNTIQ
jgi:DNA-binding HxlR family transcriptional regulator